LAAAYERLVLENAALRGAQLDDDSAGVVPSGQTRCHHSVECIVSAPGDAVSSRTGVEKEATEEELPIEVHCVVGGGKAEEVARQPKAIGENNSITSQITYNYVPSHPLPVLPTWRASQSSCCGNSPRASTSVGSKTCDVSLWQLWLESTEEPLPTLCQHQSMATMTKFLDWPSVRGGDTLRDESSLFQVLIIGPNSKMHMAWDALSIFLLSYDIFTIPLLAFSIEEEVREAGEIIPVADYVCRVFWTLDIGVKCVSGFHREGVVEMRPWFVFRNYARNWLVYDALLVTLDWLVTVLSSLPDVVGIMRLNKILRINRVLRLLRLMRLLKMPTIAHDLEDWIQSDLLYTAFGILSKLGVIAVLNHFIACGWYYIGTLSSPSWVDILDAEQRHLGYRYVTSLHWSLTQFTPASMDVQPKNVYERIYALCVLFTALVYFSHFLSSISAAMALLRQANIHRSRQRENMRRYISENKLSVDLGNRLAAFSRSHRWFHAKKRVHEEDIDVLKFVPESMRVQLHGEVYLPILTPHPLFFHFATICEDECVVELCHEAMSEVSLGTSQELFTIGVAAKRMYFMLTGLVTYFHGHSGEAQQMRGGQRCCEAVLWVKWEHQGTLSAKVHSEFVTLESQAFLQTIPRSLHMTKVCRTYAKMFKQSIDEECQLPSDLWPSEEAFDKFKEMAQSAFERHCDAHQRAGRQGTQGMHLGLRTWHSLSMNRIKADPVSHALSF
jgi:hypothetical protein